MLHHKWIYRNALPQDEQNPGSFKVREAGKQIATQFIYYAGIQSLKDVLGLPIGVLYPEQLRCHIFGSSLFNLDHKESDIDILVVGNCYILHEVFFKNLKSRLQRSHKVRGLMDASSATHPAIKFQVNVSSETTSPNPVHIDVDVLYARWHSPFVPQQIPIHLPPQDYRNLDTISLKNINGIRNCKYLLSKIPVHYRRWFGRALTIIRKWAKNQMLFRNCHGMIPGIAWSIMLMKVIQHVYGDEFYVSKESVNAPNLENCYIESIVTRFFLFYAVWDWRNPITIHAIRENDRELEMGHITVSAPCYPHHNCVRQTTRLTKNTIAMAFKNMTRLVTDLQPTYFSIMKRANTEDELAFDKSFQTYIEVGVRASKQKDFEIWRVYFRNQLSILIKDFDYPTLKLKNLLIHPEPRNGRVELPMKGVEQCNLQKSKDDRDSMKSVGYYDLWFIGINFEDEGKHVREIQIIECLVRMFLDECFQKFEKLGRLTEEMDVMRFEIKHEFNDVIEIECLERKYTEMVIGDRLEPMWREQLQVLEQYFWKEHGKPDDISESHVEHDGKFAITTIKEEDDDEDLDKDRQR